MTRVEKSEIEATGFIRRQVRDLLKTLKMYGHIQDFTEIKSFFRSTFYIKSADAVALASFAIWQRELNGDPREER